MENKLLILIAIILFAIFIINLINGLLFKKIIDLGSKGNSLLPDEKYFELKSKIESLVTIFSFIVVIAGLLGYSSFMSIQTAVLETVNKTVEKDIKSINIADSVMMQRSKENTVLLDTLKILRNEYFKELTTSAEKMNWDLSSYANEVRRMNEKLGFNNIYATNTLEIPLNKGQKNYKVFFNQIDIPKFNSVPALVIQPKDGSIINFEVHT